MTATLCGLTVGTVIGFNHQRYGDRETQTEDWIQF